jgi:hypothetical protein
MSFFAQKPLPGRVRSSIVRLPRRRRFLVDPAAVVVDGAVVVNRSRSPALLVLRILSSSRFRVSSRWPNLKQLLLLLFFAEICWRVPPLYSFILEKTRPLSIKNSHHFTYSRSKCWSGRFWIVVAITIAVTVRQNVLENKQTVVVTSVRRVVERTVPNTVVRDHHHRISAHFLGCELNKSNLMSTVLRVNRKASKRS